MLITGGCVHDGLGHAPRPADVRINDEGIIAEVGEGLAPNAGEEVLDATGQQVLPGFCQVISGWGVNGSMTEIRPSSQDNDELSDPITPQLDAFYAFNGRAASRQQLGRFGITSAGVAPTDNNLFGGLVAAFSVDGVNPYKMVLRRDCAMMASVNGKALKAAYGKKDKAPQTRMWIFSSFGEQLRRAAAYEAKPDAAPDDKLAALRRVTDGELPLWVSCDSAVAIEHVRAILERFPAVRLALVNGYGLRADDASWLVERNVPVIVRPANMPLDEPARQLDLGAIASLMQAGVCVAMGGENTNSFFCREDMIWCAGMLMRELHDSAAVLPSVTSNAAKILGVEGLTGAVEAGRRADIVLWSDDPLRTYQARVMRTLQAGRTIYREGDEHTWL